MTNYIKNLESANRDKQAALDLALAKLHSFRAFLVGPKFTGTDLDGERKDWIATHDVDDWILQIINCLIIQDSPLDANGFAKYGALTNTHALCFVLGWQGGTVHQVARELGVNTQDILTADYDRMGELCRKAQQVKQERIAS